MNNNLYIKAIKTIGFSILFILIYSSCNQEEVRPKEYPRIQTLEVTEITSAGATFKAEILSQGNQDINEYGFIWIEEGNEPALTNAEQISIKETLNANEFTIPISHALVKNINYNVKAYAKTKDFLIYGSSISFKSLGSMAPVITGFTPKNGDIGDTLTIFGENFSSLEQNITASLGGVKTRITHSKHDTLKIIVPDIIKSLESSIAISVFGNPATADETFTINPPEIESFSPSEAINNTLITIKGKNFGYGPAKVFFGEYEATVKTVTDDEITVLFPEISDLGKYKIKIEIFNQTGTSTKDIENIKFRFNSFSPNNGIWMTPIKLRVFIDPFSNPRVYFNNQSANISSKSDSLLIVNVPYSLMDSISTIKITIDGETNISSQTFKLNPIEIYNFSPKSGSEGTFVEINGNNFHPQYGKNTIQLVNSKLNAIVYYNSKNTLKFIMPDGFKSDDLLKISTGQYEVTTEELFSFNKVDIHSFSPKAITGGTTVYVKGKGFSYTKNNNKVLMNETNCIIRKASDTTLSFAVPEGMLISKSKFTVEVAGHISESSGELEFIWQRLQKFDKPTRSYPTAFIIDDNLYFGLGETDYDVSNNSVDNKDFYKYNFASNTYTRLNDFPGEVFINGTFFSYNGKGYQGLGSSTINSLPTDKIWEYNPALDQWKVKTKYPAGSLRQAAHFLIGKYIYIGTGINMYGRTSHFWRYDLENDEWNQIADYPGDEVSEAVSFSLNGIGYVGLGYGYGGSKEYKFYKYKPAFDTWQPISNPKSYWVDHYNMVNAYTIDNIAYVISRSNQIAYNPTTDTWETKAPFREGTVGSKSVAFGYKKNGYLLRGVESSDLWIYNLEMDTIPLNYY